MKLPIPTVHPKIKNKSNFDLIRQPHLLLIALAYVILYLAISAYLIGYVIILAAFGVLLSPVYLVQRIRANGGRRRG